MLDASGRFPTTAWGLLNAAQDRQAGDHLLALNRLMAAYWRPVFYFVRARGYQPQESEDLTQEFFLRLMEKQWLDSADPERGRFRTYLLTILVRFLADRRTGRAPKQQVFDRQLVSISALVGNDERTFEPAGGETAEQIFMKQWARSLMTEVQRRVESWCREQGRPDWHEIFLAVHFPPPGAQRESKQAIADRLRLTRDQVRYAVEETNRKFVEFLRAEIAQQVAAEDVEQELRELKTLLEG